VTSQEIDVLVVDDRPEEAELLEVALSRIADVAVKHPSEVSGDDIIDVDLILVDYTLEEWPSRDLVEELTQRPADGLAVISILESHTTSSATGYALYSANLNKLSQKLASPHREHAIARLHNIEWAFAKSDDAKLLSSQVVSLAKALKSASGLLLSQDAQTTRVGAQQLLGLDMSAPWHEQGWRDVERCFPPLYELSEASHGRAFVRWLAHRVVPYPTFVLEAAYVGAALGFSLPDVNREVPKPVRDFLEPAIYRGALSDLIGTRWWRAGIEYILNDRRASLANSSELRASLTEEFGMERLDALELVVCVDDSYLPSAISPIQEAVRVQPDDWPAFADPAWMRIEDVMGDPMLTALVVEEDRHLLGEAS
jgi:CheY-like chemotaxis protein